MSPPTAAYASMPSELVTCGQNFAGPPTWSSGTWAKDHSPNAQHATEMAASDQASVGAARARIRPPRGELCQTAGAGATLAEGAGAPRHQVTAIASETRSWPSMKTRKRTPGNSAPTATTDNWLAIEYIPMTANQTVIQRGTPPCDNAREAITRKPIAYSHWPAP